MDEATLQKLIDRNDIIDLFSRYADAIDRRDPVAYRACFTDLIDIETPGTQIERGAAEEWVSLAIRAVGVFQVTQHVITNHLIELDGDEASCTAILRAQHWNPDGSMMVGARYRARVVRGAPSWRITSLEMIVDWTQQG